MRRWVATPRRRLLLGALLIALLLLAVDLARPPAAQLSARGLLAAIDLYQAALSPRVARLGVRCRFRPSCSHYGEAVIRHHGALVGSAKAAWRVLRCGPWTPAGTEDPPPGAPATPPTCDDRGAERGGDICGDSRRG